MYLLPLLLIIIVITWYIYRRQLQSLVRPIKCDVQFTGAPRYIAGSTSGSPLSDLGSHCGFKAVPERMNAACSALFATTTSFGSGRLYDFAVRLEGLDDRVYFEAPQKRRVKFTPFCIEEELTDQHCKLQTRLYFLLHNVAVLETVWESTAEQITARPVFYLMPTGGRDLENPYPHLNGFTFFKKRDQGILLSNYHRVFGLKLHAYFRSSSGSGHGRKKLRGEPAVIKPGEKYSWSVIISFSADSPDAALKKTERARHKYQSLASGAHIRWDRFKNRLPVPYEDTNKTDAAALFNLAAGALQNNLYYPRGSMQRWGSVPSKVYFPFIWGWDTPQHVIGLSEWNPCRGREVLLTQLDSNHLAPRKAKFKIKIKGITVLSTVQRDQIPSKINDSLYGVLNFYSQPPLQSWAAVRLYNQFQQPDEQRSFLHDILPPLERNLIWWEENRKMADGLFSFINGLESGLDDSPRFYPPSFLPSFIIGLYPRFFGAVDLNCWLYQSYLNVSYLCAKAHRKEDAAHYWSRGQVLKELIDSELWSEEHEAWLDRRNGRFIKVITPTIWWPAFVGASNCKEKIKAVIERYLLSPEKFWGEYGIPSVAFDDSSYNSRKDGYYWRGQIWMINNYVTLEVLYRFGYHQEAAVLHERIMQTLYKSEGLYETYNARNGAVGWSSRGPGDPAVMQFGMTSAWVTQMLFYRYQNFSYLFDDTTELYGHIKWAASDDCQPVLSPPGVDMNPQEAILKVQVSGADSHVVPRLSLKSGDGKPLLKSALLLLHFADLPPAYGKTDQIEFSWLGETYQVQSGKTYTLKPLNRSEKISIQ